MIYFTLHWSNIRYHISLFYLEPRFKADIKKELKVYLYLEPRFKADIKRELTDIADELQKLKNIFGKWSILPLINYLQYALGNRICELSMSLPTTYHHLCTDYCKGKREHKIYKKCIKTSSSDDFVYTVESL